MDMEALYNLSGELYSLREEKREKRGNGCKLDSLHFYSDPEGRDGGEKGRALGERTEERKEKHSQ